MIKRCFDIGKNFNKMKVDDECLNIL